MYLMMMMMMMITEFLVCELSRDSCGSVGNSRRRCNNSRQKSRLNAVGYNACKHVMYVIVMKMIIFVVEMMH